MMLRKHKGYWTIFCNGVPTLAFSTFEAAWTAIIDAYTPDTL